MEIVDTIHINGFQSFKIQANISYLVDIEIENDKLWNFAARQKGREFFYRFTIESLLFRPSITNNTKTIFITCNGLNDAKKTIIHDKNYKILGVVNLEEITNWIAVKGSSSWVGVKFVDGNYLAQGSNFAVAFESKNINNSIKFSFKSLNTKQKIIKF